MSVLDKTGLYVGYVSGNAFIGSLHVEGFAYQRAVDGLVVDGLEGGLKATLPPVKPMNGLDKDTELVQNTTIAANNEMQQIGVSTMEKYLNSIHYVAATVVEYGKNMGNGVWKGVGTTVIRSGLQVGFTELITIRIQSHGWNATILVKKASIGDETHELVESAGLTKELLEEAIVREEQLRQYQPKYSV